jgi:hypothetical protein
VGECSRIDQDEAGAILSGGMNAIHESPFVVALHAFQCEAGGFGLRRQPLIDAVESVRAIYARFAGSQQVQIGAVQDKNLRHYWYDFPGGSGR